MSRLRVAGATLNQTPFDVRGNEDRIRSILSAAKADDVAVLCLPELSLTGYNCEDMFTSPALERSAEQMLGRLLPLTQNMLVVFGMPVSFAGNLYNCAVVVQDGVILGVNPKKALPREGIHYEPRWFTPWPPRVVRETALCGVTVPFGDIRYECGDIGIAIEICEEAWTAESMVADHVRSGAMLVLNPSASHFALGKFATRSRLVADRSRALQVNYVYSNLVGLESGRVIYDGGVLIAECGRFRRIGPRFGCSDGDMVATDVDMDLPRAQRYRGRSARHVDEASVTLTVAVQGKPLPLRPESRELAEVTIEVLSPPIEEEFLRAEMRGLFDYSRKSGARGFVVSLSGGCDSAACALLVAHMYADALATLGPDGLQQALGWGPKGDRQDARSWVKAGLTCIYQATEHSGLVTHAAAQGLAEELGATFMDARVDDVVSAYVQKAEALLGRSLTWEQDDVPLQNIQARVRGPLAWMIANVKGALLLSTSNRSEVAVGYATMDGDTAGGLAPLAGIDKRFLRRFLRWAETQSVMGLGALPSLAAVNAQAPTAELRPPAMQQTDEKDLMPYEVLERIERYFVRDRLAGSAILANVAVDFPQYPEGELRLWVDRFLGLWRISQWKRERYAPGFHIDDESLDPKTWFRYPILSGRWLP